MNPRTWLAEPPGYDFKHEVQVTVRWHDCACTEDLTIRSPFAADVLQNTGFDFDQVFSDLECLHCQLPEQPRKQLPRQKIPLPPSPSAQVLKIMAVEKHVDNIERTLSAPFYFPAKAADIWLEIDKLADFHGDLGPGVFGTSDMGDEDAEKKNAEEERNEWRLTFARVCLDRVEYDSELVNDLVASIRRKMKLRNKDNEVLNREGVQQAVREVFLTAKWAETKHVQNMIIDWVNEFMRSKSAEPSSNSEI